MLRNKTSKIGVAYIFYLKKYIKFKKMYVILLIEKKYYPKSTVLRYERVQ